jgi:hypothetical protein
MSWRSRRTASACEVQDLLKARGVPLGEDLVEQVEDLGFVLSGRHLILAWLYSSAHATELIGLAEEAKRPEG